MASRDLNEAENERLRAAVRALLARPGVTQLSLAPGLGVGQPALSGFLAGRQGSSYAVARKAAAMLGTDTEAILAGTARPPEPSETTVDRSSGQAPAPSDEETPLDRAIVHAWTAATMKSADAYALADMRNAQTAARGVSRLATADTDLESAAQTYLKAARKVRVAGIVSRPGEIALAIRDEAMAMLLPTRPDVTAQLTRDANAEAKAMSDAFDAEVPPTLRANNAGEKVRSERATVSLSREEIAKAIASEREALAPEVAKPKPAAKKTRRK